MFDKAATRRLEERGLTRYKLSHALHGIVGQSTLYRFFSGNYSEGGPDSNTVRAIFDVLELVVVPIESLPADVLADLRKRGYIPEEKRKR